MIIDMHAHFWEKFMNFQCPPVEEIIRGMDEAGIDITLLNSLSGLLKTDPHEDNLKIRSIALEYSSRIEGIAVVDPYAEEAALKELETCLRDYHFKGLKLHPWLQGYYANADFLGPLFDLCRSYSVPVMIHTGTPPYAQVFQVGYQAKKFPKVTFILCHMGLNYQWRDAIEVGRSCPNALFDTCGITYTFAIKELIKELGPERIMFGSDNPFLFPDIELEKVKALGLGKEEIKLVLSDNANRVFKLGKG